MTYRQTGLILVLAFSLSACGFGQSRLNPFNWFRSGPEVETLQTVEILNQTDARPLVEQVTSLEVERTPGGAIIRASGLPPSQGWYDAELVPENRDAEPVGGILSFTLRAVPPADPRRVSTVQSRELVVGRFVSEITLASTREIRVIASRNIRTSRR
ncbi:MAG: hypothetical protein QNJ35_01230 [Paracoccaceae bacterium]|nr:hypothetical protein [Paracoccaceae bacterium]